jgi:hypothetical protein
LRAAKSKRLTSPLPAREGLGVGCERSELSETVEIEKRPGIEPDLF